MTAVFVEYRSTQSKRRRVKKNGATKKAIQVGTEKRSPGTRCQNTKNERHPELYYYEMRHGGLDWDTPITIEDFLAVNFYGTLVTCVPLELTDNQPGEAAYIKLKLKEREYLREREAEELRSKSNVKD